MAQIDTTKTWLPGDSVDAAGMNNIIDQATAETPIITGQTAVVTLQPSADYVLVYDASASALRKTLVENLPSGVNSVSFTATPTSVFTAAVDDTPPETPALSLVLKNQNANKVLAAPNDGTSAQPSFRAIVPRDIVIAPQEISASLIDWSLGFTFYKTLTAATYNFTFSNPRAGQRIIVLLKKSADTTNTVSWASTIRWPGGLNYALSTAANAHDLIEFWFIDGQYYADPFRVDMRT